MRIQSLAVTDVTYELFDPPREGNLTLQTHNTPIRISLEPSRQQPLQDQGCSSHLTPKNPHSLTDIKLSQSFVHTEA